MNPRSTRSPRSSRPAPDDASLLTANRRLSVDERLRRHDAALNDLLALRAAVRARRAHV